MVPTWLKGAGLFLLGAVLAPIIQDVSVPFRERVLTDGPSFLTQVRDGISLQLAFMSLFCLFVLGQAQYRLKSRSVTERVDGFFVLLVPTMCVGDLVVYSINGITGRRELLASHFREHSSGSIFGLSAAVIVYYAVQSYRRRRDGRRANHNGREEVV
jgi:hypothetical protein